MRSNGKFTGIKTLSVRISEAEHEALFALAKERNTTTSRLVANAVREILTKHAAFLDEQGEQLTELILQVAAVGRNINQIAHAANRQKSQVFVDHAALKAVMDVLAAQREALQQMKDSAIYRWADVLER